MTRYACKFCIALYGPQGSGDLPSTREEAERHVAREHGYPKRSAEEILGPPQLCRYFPELIEATGPVVRVDSVHG